MFRKIRNVIETLVAELRNENYYSIAQQLKDSDAHEQRLMTVISANDYTISELNKRIDGLEWDASVAEDRIAELEDDLAAAINADR